VNQPTHARFVFVRPNLYGGVMLCFWPSTSPHKRRPLFHDSDAFVRHEPDGADHPHRLRARGMYFPNPWEEPVRGPLRPPTGNPLCRSDRFGQFPRRTESREPLSRSFHYISGPAGLGFLHRPGELSSTPFVVGAGTVPHGRPPTHGAEHVVGPNPARVITIRAELFRPQR